MKLIFVCKDEEEVISSLDVEFEFVRIMRQNVLPRAASVYAYQYFMEHVREIAPIIFLY